MSEIPEKLFYKVGEVCKYTDTQPYVLRFWETEFPQLAPNKNRTGQRVYRREDLETVLQIKKLLYEQEYTIADARRALDATLLDGPSADSRSDDPEDREEGELWTDVLPEAAAPVPEARGGRAFDADAAPVESRPSHAELAALRARVESLEERCRLAEEALSASEEERKSLRARADRVAGRLERLLGTVSRTGDAKPSSTP